MTPISDRATHILALHYSQYAEQSDPRLAELARKQDNGEITDKELDELVDRMDRAMTRFLQEKGMR